MSANAASLFDQGVETEATAAAEAAKVAGGDQAAQDAAAAAVRGKTAWNMAEGLPGSGPAPDWFDGKKYKTVADQAASVPELVTKLGAITGAPDKYDLALSAEFLEKHKDIEGVDEKHALLGPVLDRCKAAGLSQDFVKGLVEDFITFQASEVASIEAEAAENFKALGADGQERLNDIDSWLTATFPEGTDEGLRQVVKNWCVTDDDLKAVERLMKTGAGAKVPRGPGNTSGHTPESVKALKFAVHEDGPHKGKLKYDTDPEYRKEVKEAYKALYGDAPQSEVVDFKT